MLLRRRRPSLSDTLFALDGKLRRRPGVREALAALDIARGPLCELFLNQLDSPIAAKALTLKALNLLLAKYHLRSRHIEVMSRPFGLIVDPSNGCNLSCPGCVHSANSRSLKLFDWNNALLSEECFHGLFRRHGPYSVEVMFCNYGEPTANLKTPRLIEIAKSFLTKTVISTNLTIGRFDAEAYVRSGLDLMYISIDGATQRVYEKFRRGGNLEAVFRNLRKLVEAKRDIGKATPLLRWQFLAFEHNIHEIPLALELARNMGLDQFGVAVPFDVTWDDPSIRPARGFRPLTVELQSDPESKLRQNMSAPPSGPAAEEIESEFSRSWQDRLRDSSEACSRRTTSQHTCSWLYKNMAMDAHGRILPCCCAPKPGFNLVFGNIADAESDSFNTGLYRRARRHFAMGADPNLTAPDDPHCVRCEWDQSHTQADKLEVAQYLRIAAKGCLDFAAVRVLSDW